MEKVGKIIILTSAWLLCTCVTDYEKVAPPTELEIVINNESNAPLDGADVYLFDDVNAFNLAVSTGTPAGASAQTKSVNGIAQLSQLNPDASYYVYAIYKDNTIYPGTYVTLDNSTEKYIVKNKLTRGSVTYLTIILKPADGFITFWTAATNTLALPIDIFYGATAMGADTQAFASPPALLQPGALTIRTRKGVITFEGRSGSGCLWTGTITLVGAQSVFFQLQDCSVGTIAFFTDNSNSTKLPISLQLNGNDVLSNITSTVSAVPTDCSASNLVQIVRTTGDYTYLATSTTGACSWTGSFTLNANECKLIPLNTCP